jgi:RNA polymerase sigma-70 factor (ECF subfamily)
MLEGENQIIERAKKGEAQAFGLLYDHYHERIYRFIFLKVSRKEDAEDLTHQVFLSAWQNIKNYKELGFPFSSWLYRISRNAVIDFYRSKKIETSLEEVQNELSSDEIKTDDIDLKIQIEEVMKALKQLKPDYQDIIIMRFVDDLSVKEIAKALDKSEGAVKLMQHRAINNLKKILKI